MNSEALLKQYVDTGLKIPEYQFNKLNSNQRGTYLRKRYLAFNADNRQNISYEMNYFPEDIQHKIVKAEYSLADLIKNPSPELQKKMIDDNPYIISYINNPTEYAQRNGLSGFVDYDILKNGTLDEVKKQALQNNPSAIEYIYNPSEEMQLYAINQRPQLIGSIKNPTPKVQMFFVTHHPHLFRMIFRPSIEAQRYMLDNHADYIGTDTPNLDITIQRRLVTKNPHFIMKIDNPSEEIQMLAINANPHVINHIDDPSYEVQKRALALNPLTILYFFCPTEQQQMIAVKSNPRAIFSIKDVVPADSVQLYVAKNDPKTYSRYVENAMYHSQRYRDLVPSPSVKKYWEDKKPLNENINRLKELL